VSEKRRPYLLSSAKKKGKTGFFAKGMDLLQRDLLQLAPKKNISGDLFARKRGGQMQVHPAAVVEENKGRRMEVI